MTKDPTAATGNAASAQLLITIGNWFFDGWLLMLAFGVAHGEVHKLPTFGYWQSWFFAWVFMGIAATANFTLGERVKRLGVLVATRDATGPSMSEILKSIKVLNG